MNKQLENLSSEELRAESERLHKQLEEAKQSVDRLFSGNSSEEDLNKIGEFILNSQRIRDELTEAKMYDFASIMKAQKLYEFLREKFPKAEVELVKDEYFNRVSVQAIQNKGLHFVEDVWDKILELSKGSLDVGALIDDLDPDNAGMYFSFNLMLYKYKK